MNGLHNCKHRNKIQNFWMASSNVNNQIRYWHEIVHMSSSVTEKLRNHYPAKLWRECVSNREILQKTNWCSQRCFKRKKDTNVINANPSFWPYVRLIDWLFEHSTLILCFVFCLLLLFIKTGFLCSFGTWSGTCSVDQAGLKLIEICLPLPSKCWN